MENAAARMVRGKDPIRHHVRRKVRHRVMVRPAPHTKFPTVLLWRRPATARANSERPVLGPLVPVIDAILEADKAAPPKQTHTAKRIRQGRPVISARRS